MGMFEHLSKREIKERIQQLQLLQAKIFNIYREKNIEKLRESIKKKLENEINQKT